MKKLFLAAVLAAIATAAQAQSYPTRPVTIIVPYPPGGPTDQVARQIAPKLSAKFGQNFMVENVSGGGTNIAGQRVAHCGARRPHAVDPQPADFGQRLALQDICRSTPRRISPRSP